MLQRFWRSGDLTHKQCMKNLLQLVEVGDIDLKILGLPLQPKKDRFEYIHLNKREDSNPTYYVAYGQVKFVVRMKPPGAEYQHLHRVCVEYEVLSYLHRKGLPVPKPYTSSQEKVSLERSSLSWSMWMALFLKNTAYQTFSLLSEGRFISP